jgi:fumarylacetoacetate (FAA) hydrolase
MAYSSHAQLLQNSAPSPALQEDASDPLWGACDDIEIDDDTQDIDFAAGLAVVTGDVPQGTNAERALEGVRLVMLANTLSLRRGGMPRTLASAFGPVAVTVDELGPAWQQGRLHLTLQSSWNGRKVGLCDAGADMNVHFGQLIAQLCTLKPLRAGAVVGSGPVSHAGTPDSKGRLQWPKGYNCIAEKRAMETLQDGQASTEFLKFGDTLRLEMKDRQGQSLFGTLESTLAATQR